MPAVCMVQDSHHKVRNVHEEGERDWAAGTEAE